MADEPASNSLDDLYSALRAADAAGDTEGAQRLAEYIQAQSAGTAKAPVPQMTGALRLPEMAAEALATGVQNMIGLPGNMLALGNRIFPTPTFKPRNALESGLDKLNNALALPTGTGIAKFTGLGLENRPDLTPGMGENPKLERYGTAAIEGVPSALPVVLSGGAALPALGIGVSSNLAAEGAAELAPNSTWLPIAAGVLTGLGFGGITAGLMRSATSKAAAKALSQAQADYQAARNSAFDTRSAAIANAESVRAKYQSVMTNAKSLAKSLADDTAEHVSNTFEDVAGDLGKSTTYQQAGRVGQAAARNWYDKIRPEEFKAVEATLKAKVPDEAPTPLPQFTAAAQALSSDAGSLQAINDLFARKMPAQVTQALARREAQPAAEAALKELMEPGVPKAGASAESKALPPPAPPPTFAEARTLRSTLGDALANPDIVKSLGQKNINTLYRALSADLGETAKGLGALEEWNTYNTVSTDLHNFVAGPLSKVISTVNPAKEITIAPEDAARALIKSGQSGSTDLDALRARIPEAVDELAAAHLRRGGADAWKELPSESQNALAPRAGHVSSLNEAIKTNETVQAGLKNVMQNAKAEADARVADARGSVKTLSAEQQKALREAQARVAAAKTNMGKPESPVNQLVHTARSAMGGVLGGDVIPNGLSFFGDTMGPLGKAAMTAGGLVAPTLARAVKHMLSNPKNLGPPLTGVVAGENALAPQKARQQP